MMQVVYIFQLFLVATWSLTLRFVETTSLFHWAKYSHLHKKHGSFRLLNLATFRSRHIHHHLDLPHTPCCRFHQNPWTRFVTSCCWTPLFVPLLLQGPCDKLHHQRTPRLLCYLVGCLLTPITGFGRLLECISWLRRLHPVWLATAIARPFAALF